MFSIGKIFMQGSFATSSSFRGPSILTPDVKYKKKYFGMSSKVHLTEGFTSQEQEPHKIQTLGAKWAT